MAKAITDICGLAQELQRQFGGDLLDIGAVCDRFSENVVIAADSYAVAVDIVNIAGENITIEDHWTMAGKLLEDEGVAFDAILDKYRDTDQDSVGYTYRALTEAVLNVYSKSDCVEIVRRHI
jgi:hypothetical protein